MFKEYFKDKKAVLMDLDGTIINSHILWNEACSEVASNLGFTWKGYYFFKEPSLEETWSSYLDFTGENYGVPLQTLITQTKDKFISQVLSRSPDDILKAGFWEFIGEIKHERGFKVGLVTNSDREVAEKVLSHLGIGNVFALKVFGDDVKKKKPDPEIYEKALKEIGFKSKEVLVFEDAPLGIKAAKKAGLTVIAFMNRLYPEEDYSPKDIVVDDFTAFLGNLDKNEKEFMEEKFAYSKNSSANSDMA